MKTKGQLAKPQMFLFGFLLITVSLPPTVSAQSAFSFSAGAGYYESINVGVHWNYSKRSSVGMYGGTNFRLTDEKIRCVGLDYTHVYAKPILWILQPGFSFEPQYWTQDDENYNFKNLCLISQAILRCPINEILSVNIKGGAVLNYAIETERKQNTTVGYPTRWNGNLALTLTCRIQSAKP